MDDVVAQRPARPATDAAAAVVDAAERRTPDPAIAVDETNGMDAAAVREVLRACGLRYSRPREAILGYMAGGGRHESAESLFQALRDRGEDLSLSTVYLNLGVLVGAGLLREFVGARGESLYDGNVEPHYHLICGDTGEVVDVPAPTIEGRPLGAYLKAYVERVTGWHVDEARLSFRGRPKATTTAGFDDEP
ncbi:MAG: transcriptional repressor [Trueperaceae bacterium]|nr:transcriptional repressor [Trueperaceae bacterium]